MSSSWTQQKRRSLILNGLRFLLTKTAPKLLRLFLHDGISLEKMIIAPYPILRDGHGYHLY